MPRCAPCKCEPGISFFHRLSLLACSFWWGINCLTWRWGKAASSRADADVLFLDEASPETGAFVRRVSEALLQCLGFLQSRSEESIALALCRGRWRMACQSLTASDVIGFLFSACCIQRSVLWTSWLPILPRIQWIGELGVLDLRV